MAVPPRRPALMMAALAVAAAASFLGGAARAQTVSFGVSATRTDAASPPAPAGERF